MLNGRSRNHSKMKSTRLWMRFLPLLAGTTLHQIPNVQAQVVSTTEHQVLTSAESFNEFYGGVLAMSGDTLVVGAPFAVVNGQTNAGRAYVYSRSTGSWVLEDILTPDDTVSGQQFGWSLDIDGDRILAGANLDFELLPAAGAAYVFERSGTSWTQTAKLYDNNPGFAHFFGTTVALDGDYALVGADQNGGAFAPLVTELQTFSLNSGSWQYDGSLTPTLSGSEFGDVVAARPGEFCVLQGSGNLEIAFYQRTGNAWNLVQTLPSTGYADDYSFSDSFLVTTRSGLIKVYERVAGSWVFETDLFPTPLNGTSEYGFSVDIEGSTIVAGTRGISLPSPELGEAIVFERSNTEWVEKARLETSGAILNEGFGRKIAIEDSQVVVAARFGTPMAKAYAFDLNEAPQSFCEADGSDGLGCGACPCGNDAPAGSSGGCLNSAGTSATLRVSGGSSLAEDTLRLELEGGNPLSFAILVSGSQRAPNNMANPCFGSGTGIISPALAGLRCVVQDVRRQGTRATDAQGSVGITNNGWGGTDGPAGGLLAQAGLVAGQTRHYQAFYRETPTAGCMGEQNTSQGISIVVRP